jgi:serine/threonine protein kinase/Flp pilus assembly protein TadD
MQTRHGAPTVAGNDEDAELAQVLDAYLADLEVGRPADPDQVVAEHPAIAERLRACLIGLHQIEHGNPLLGPPKDTGQPRPRNARLGDYRLIREVGRGGMGVVYEAEQLSLGRRVALKVLPFAAALDPKQLQRFKTEAQAAAHLHHTNIVPVFDVGSERGVHFYSMQFIEGQTLAALIHQLRLSAGKEETAPRPLAGEPTGPADAPQQTVPTPNATPRAGMDALTLPVAQGPAFYRSLARLGVQAAEALEHAHQVGVIHRDVKPANLMVDAGGRLWVADFGLARCLGAAGLTLTGDVICTLRYASPEQLQGRPGAVDHRTDVYSLGVTLYELLTLEHPFDGQDRQELLRRIASEEPVPPRRRNRAVPAELEVVVLKAMEKDPADRYGTAQELAGDLQHFLDDKPINARRPTLLQRLRRWGRRHQPLVWSAVVFGLLTLGVVAASLGWVVRDRAAREAALDDQVGRYLDGAEGLLVEGKWPEAKSALERVEKFLAVAGRTEQPPRLRELRRDVAMAERLEGVYSQPISEEYDTDRQQDAAYAEAFRDYGIDVAVLPPEDAAERMRARPIRQDLALAMDFWSISRRHSGNPEPDWKQLLEISSNADPDPWRNRLRKALQHDDRQELATQAASVDVCQLPPKSLGLLARTLTYLPKPKGKATVLTKETYLDGTARQQVAVFLRKAQRQYPRDLWLNLALAEFCLYYGGKPDEAICFYTVALTLRPESPYVAYGLGMALLRTIPLRRPSRVDIVREAIAEFSKAIELKPDFLNAFAERGRLYMELGQPAEALADAARAIELGSESPRDWFCRGWAYMRLAQWDRAIVDFSKALEMEPRYSQAHEHRAYAYSILGEWDKAATDVFPGGALQRATWPYADERAFQLACLRLLEGDVKSYHQQCQQVVVSFGQIKIPPPEENAFRVSRTCMLRPETNPTPAQGVIWAEKAVASDLKSACYLHALGLAHYRAGQFKEAVQRSHDSLMADPRWGGNPLNWLLLALAYQRLGQPEDARPWLDKASAWQQRAIRGSSPKGEPPTPPDVHLSDWLEFQVLWREAEELLKQEKAVK